MAGAQVVAQAPRAAGRPAPSGVLRELRAWPTVLLVAFCLLVGVPVTVALTPAQEVVALGQHLSVGARTPTPTLSGPAQLVQIGNTELDMPRLRIHGPLRPRLTMGPVQRNAAAAQVFDPLTSAQAQAQAIDNVTRGFLRWYLWGGLGPARVRPRRGGRRGLPADARGAPRPQPGGRRRRAARRRGDLAPPQRRDRADDRHRRRRLRARLGRGRRPGVHGHGARAAAGRLADRSGRVVVGVAGAGRPGGHRLHRRGDRRLAGGPRRRPAGGEPGARGRRVRPQHRLAGRRGREPARRTGHEPRVPERDDRGGPARAAGTRRAAAAAAGRRAQAGAGAAVRRGRDRAERPGLVGPRHLLLRRRELRGQPQPGRVRLPPRRVRPRLRHPARRAGRAARTAAGDRGDLVRRAARHRRTRRARTCAARPGRRA